MNTTVPRSGAPDPLADLRVTARLGFRTVLAGPTGRGLPGGGADGTAATNRSRKFAQSPITRKRHKVST
ncbi:hypothetical protein [Azospirillum halopraeferens]|uniref:hypothetical protein n=1 Tax=Azospirillum halopraeferens TaxID=34010 RepID=UPI0012EC70F4|nr:hypothetical protein [Azospirillum halopraeferens]